MRHHSSRSRSISPVVYGDGGGFISIGQEENDSQLNGRTESDIATSLAAAAAAELPCTVWFSSCITGNQSCSLFDFNSSQFIFQSPYILLPHILPVPKHSSLLRSIVIDGETTVPIYTILEVRFKVYRVYDMELVRVLPSAEDEVNEGCFHPLVSEGLVYGTKCGRIGSTAADVTPIIHTSSSMPEVATRPASD
ncbi:hypothetical protein GIB67_014954 [Kingdonia uniflora]|uniref:Uncharacterized protein n=1 Tax=Kingdonia uniflora TaxID=39325 RepID=A0A7J7MTQ3_9MAGN|nr:hypothetical protein GIB67_014954 [Kingdonia uniflora]